MATPYNIWTGLTPGVPVLPIPAPLPMMQGFFPGHPGYGHPMGGMGIPMGPGMGMGWGIPAIPPSSHPMLINPEGAVRDFAEHVLSGDRKNMCTERDAAIIGDWCKNDDYKEIIMEVIKARIDLPWPYNYKTLDLLGSCPLGMAVDLIDKIKGLAEAAATTEGSSNLHKLGKALLDKAEKEKGKMDEEEAKKRQEAVMAMWGGLWANDGYKVPGALAQAGWGGWQNPYQMVGPPGVPAQANVEWKGNAPEGWQGSKITAIPQVYPFSRTGYYALIPEDHKPPEGPKAGTFTVSVVPGAVSG